VSAISVEFLKELIAGKLSSNGISAQESLVAKLVDHILAGNSHTFVWDDGKPQSGEIEIAITNDEISELDNRITVFLKNDIPSIIETSADRAADDLLTSLKREWPNQAYWERSVTSEFRESLQTRWGQGLNLLRMLLTISLEIGSENLKRHNRSKRRKKSHLSEVLIRLHARACQVAAEILVLMEAGFADGAMARWRTLHEIGVVAAFISQFGEESAERYFAHQAVEAKAGMDEYARSSTNLGFQPIDSRTARRISNDYDKVVAKYGKEFASPYGWAAKDLNKRKPIFPDIETVVGQALMRSHYKFASYNVHAGPQGIFFRLGLLTPGGIIAGASNAGLTEPGQNMAATLALVNALLFGPRWTFEDIVTLKLLKKLNDQIPSFLLRSERKLKRDDISHRKKQTETRSKRGRPR
jgi:hypothetical protein